MRARILEPELLDTLPPSDPAAIASRRDLRRVNACMGSARLLASWLCATGLGDAPRRIVDLGAGDGAFTLRCLALLPGLPRNLEVCLIDRNDTTDPRVMAALQARGFRPRTVQADATTWLREQPSVNGTWLLTNLFLHHLHPTDLRELFGLVAAKSVLFCACEPRRDMWPLAVSRLLGLMGANAVTRHDAMVSVRAGFRDCELTALWPVDHPWIVREGRAGWFSHCFSARRR